MHNAVHAGVHHVGPGFHIAGVRHRQQAMGMSSGYRRCHGLFTEGGNIRVEHLEVVVDDLDVVRPLIHPRRHKRLGVFRLDQGRHLGPLGTVRPRRGDPQHRAEQICPVMRRALLALGPHGAGELPVGGSHVHHRGHAEIQRPGQHGHGPGMGVGIDQAGQQGLARTVEDHGALWKFDSLTSAHHLRYGVATGHHGGAGNHRLAVEQAHIGNHQRRLGTIGCDGERWSQ